MSDNYALILINLAKTLELFVQHPKSCGFWTPRRSNYEPKGSDRCTCGLAELREQVRLLPPVGYKSAVELKKLADPVKLAKLVKIEKA